MAALVLHPHAVLPPVEQVPCVRQSTEHGWMLWDTQKRQKQFHFQELDRNWNVYKGIGTRMLTATLFVMA